MPARPPQSTTTRTARDALRALPATVWLLGWASLLTDIASEMAFPLLPAFIVSLGAAPTFLGLVEGIANALASGMSLASTRLTRAGRPAKGFILLGYGLGTLARPMFALAQVPWHVMGARSIDRLGKGLRSAPRDALLAAVVPPNATGRAFGVHRAMDHAGAVIGPLLAFALLAARIPTRWIFAAATLPATLALLVLMRLPGAPPSASLESDSLAAAAAAPPDQTRATTTARAGTALLLIQYLLTAAESFALLRAATCHVTLAHLPLVWAGLHVVKVAAAAQGGRMVDRFTAGRVLAVGLAIGAVAFALLAMARTSVGYGFAMLGMGMRYGLCEAAERAFVATTARARDDRHAFGSYHFVVGITAIPNGLLVGALWQHIGGTTTLGLSAIVCALCAVAWWAMVRKANGLASRAVA